MRIRFATSSCLFFAATFALTGCTGGSLPNNAPALPASFLYSVSYPGFPSSGINGYPVASAGNSVAATSSVTIGASIAPMYRFGPSMHGDGAGNVYILNGVTSNYQMNIYSTSAGALTFRRSFTFPITISNGNLVSPESFAADPTGIVYVSMYDGTLLKFPANATGAVTPTVINIGIPLVPMATDSAGNLYGYPLNTSFANFTVNEGLIGEYPANLTSATTSKVLFFPSLSRSTVADMVLDSNDNIYITGVDLTTSTPFISEFSSAAGTTTPMKTISGSSTLINGFSALAVDGAGNIYSEGANLASMAIIYTFSATATGNVAPTHQFTPATSFTNGLVAY